MLATVVHYCPKIYKCRAAGWGGASFNINLSIMSTKNSAAFTLFADKLMFDLFVDDVITTGFKYKLLTRSFQAVTLIVVNRIKN